MSDGINLDVDSAGNGTGNSLAARGRPPVCAISGGSTELTFVEPSHTGLILVGNLGRRAPVRWQIPPGSAASAERWASLAGVCGTSSAHDARDVPLTLTDTTLHESCGENQPAETRILQ